ncbi:Ppx/GppA family phosphatase [Alkalibacterium sp. 20]|uniref:Ppx/GppA family phosphatase n=1 Tax=Alkalibacterium sp. 20 TaxID=1798803 RepID=UPI0008FFFE1C|nr:Ppx/GppA family phosphatase [Alkalibacterium sp. 20]OJF95946.1 exopolyphosphatase [Alkalibacterium sp. 20]
MTRDRFGLLDVGSNTIRLVIFEMDDYQGITELQNIKTPARLVQYLDTKNIMSEEGINVLITVLKSFTKIAESYKIKDLIAIATAAIRQSTNRDVIIARVKKEVDLELTILTEQKEAYFGNYAVRYTMDIPDGVSIDIGGGSTEVTYFKNKEIKEAHSFPFGTVSLQKQFFDEKKHNDKKAIKKARKWVNEQLKTLDWLENLSVPLIGIGGSARNYAEIYQRETDYPIAGIHEYQMFKDDLDETFDLLVKSSMEELGDLDGLSEDRRDIIIPAGIVFTELINVMEAKSFAISNRGLREGIILERLNQEYDDAYDLFGIKRQTVQRLFKQYDIRPISAHQRIILADRLIELIKDKGILDIKDEHLYLLHYGATLYYLSSYIEDDSKSQHTFYIISNTNLHGFNHSDRVRLALLASYKNRSLYKQYTSNFKGWYDKKELDVLLYLGSIIKFAEALSDSHVNFVHDMDLIETDDDNYELCVTYSGEAIAEEYRANRHKNHIERVLGKSLSITFQKELDESVQTEV